MSKNKEELNALKGKYEELPEGCNRAFDGRSGTGYRRDKRSP